MQRIGFFGGTFNPVHNEHIAIALSAIKELKLDKLIVMPTFIPPHKTGNFAPSSDRLNMCKLAFGGIDKVEVSDYEIVKGGTSYSYLTLTHLKEKYNANLFFIMGEDLIGTFSTWKNPDIICKLSDIAVFGRENYSIDLVNEQKDFEKKFGKSFYKLNYNGKKVSSTLVRAFSNLSLPLTELVPNAVEDYIKKNGLYKEAEFEKYTEFVKKNEKESRLRHTAYVIECSLRKAGENGLDKREVYISALLHDCAKYLDYANYADFTLPKGIVPPVIHSFLGEYVARNVLDIENEEILQAIKYHTSGKPEMTKLGKLIFVADMVEDTREYQGVEDLRKIYETQSLDNAFKACLKEEMIHLKNKNQPIFDLTEKAYDYYVVKEKK